MHTNWSTYVQSTEELYQSRACRMHEGNRAMWLEAIGAQPGMRVLEVGCAGGAFCHRLKGWLPDITITGVDRDSAHIAYANEKTARLGLDCTFVEGDACALPFADGMFDLAYSHTVLEHVPHEAFLSQQLRVLKPGGRLVILSVYPQRGFSWSPPADAAYAREWKAMQEAWKRLPDMDAALEVCAYPLQPEEIAPLLERHGLREISINCIMAVEAPDSADLPQGVARAMLEARRTGDLATIDKLLARDANALDGAQVQRLRAAVHARYDRRIRQLDARERVWEIDVRPVLVVSGFK